VSKGKLYSTLVLNLLLYGCKNWVLTAPLRHRLNTFHNRCVRAMARPQRTFFSSTNDHPAAFVKRPALAPMYTALGLTSLDLTPSFQSLEISSSSTCAPLPPPVAPSAPPRLGRARLWPSVNLWVHACGPPRRREAVAPASSPGRNGEECKS
jgi:hypothetical protein